MWLADVVALPLLFATVDFWQAMAWWKQVVENRLGGGGPGGPAVVGVGTFVLLLCSAAPLLGLTDLARSPFLQTGRKWLWGMVSPVLHCQQEALLKSRE